MERGALAEKRPEGRNKPEGGFRFITVEQVCTVWSLYRAGVLESLDFRVYFALHEVAERRKGWESTRKSRLELEELQGLVGTRDTRRLRTAYRRLRDAGLVTFIDSKLNLTGRSEIVAGDRAFEAMLVEFKKPGRAVPIPRRMVRELAGRSGRAFAATVLGHALRCLRYKRGGEVTFSGLCKASWIAGTFGVSLRGIKQGRAELVAEGWLSTTEAPQWSLNRFGARAAVNPEWGRVGPRNSGEKNARRVKRSAPPPPDSAQSFAPPESNQEPLRVSKSQNSSGFQKSSRRGFGRDIEFAELRNRATIAQLFEEFATKGFLQSHYDNHRRFVAAVIHARRIANRNAPGLLFKLVRDGLWANITDADWDKAVVLLGRDGADVGHDRHATEARDGDAASNRRRQEIRAQLAEVTARLAGEPAEWRT